MQKKQIHALIVLLFGMLLQGCATTIPQQAPLTIPANMLLCQEAPQVPNEPTDKDLAYYILDLSNAGSDCREKLHAIKNIEEPDDGKK